MPDPGEKIPKKKFKEIQKNWKTSFQQYFYPNQAEIGREREKKKISSRILFLPDAGNKILKKIERIFKKLKNFILPLFLFEPGWDRLGNSEKKKKIP